jgi:hypothetical protein
MKKRTKVNNKPKTSKKNENLANKYKYLDKGDIRNVMMFYSK